MRLLTVAFSTFEIFCWTPIVLPVPSSELKQQWKVPDLSIKLNTLRIWSANIFFSSSTNVIICSAEVQWLSYSFVTLGNWAIPGFQREILGGKLCTFSLISSLKKNNAFTRQTFQDRVEKGLYKEWWWTWDCPLVLSANLSGSTEPPAFLSTPHSGLGLADRLFAQGDCCPAHPAGSTGRFWMGFLDRALLLLLLLDTLEKNVWQIDSAPLS